MYLKLIFEPKLLISIKCSFIIYLYHCVEIYIGILLLGFSKNLKNCNYNDYQYGFRKI